MDIFVGCPLEEIRALSVLPNRVECGNELCTFRLGQDAHAFQSPRDALDNGIATVYQDLATVPLMSIARNFFMGRYGRRVAEMEWDLLTTLEELG